jgi:hypothetical protein
VKKASKRRLLALALPLPILLAGYLLIRHAPLSTSMHAALMFPVVVAYFLAMYFGIKSFSVAVALGTGYWYLLLSLGAYAVLCGRDRVSKALTVCVLATTAVVIGVVFLLRNWNPD